MNAASQRRLTPILVAIALLLAALWLAVSTGLGRSVQWSKPRVKAPPLSPHRAAALPAPLPLAEFEPVWQLSLFSPTRKPEKHAANGGSSLGDLSLTGVILTPQLHMALLHDKGSDHELRVREGHSLPDSNVSLVEVRQRSVILDSPQGRTELKLPAGAPINNAEAAPVSNAEQLPPSPRNDHATTGAAMVQEVHRVVSPQGQSQVGAVRNPPPYSPQQIERLRKLKAATLKHPTSGRTAANEGVH